MFRIQNHQRLSFGLLVVILLALGHASVASAQITLEGTEYRDVSAVLQDIGARSLVYRPVSKDDKQLYYVPFFAFKADKDNKLDVAVLNGTTPNTKKIAIWLLLSPQNKIDAIASIIRTEEAKTPVDGRYANVQPSQLIGLLFSNLDVTEEEPRIGFRAVRQSNYAPQGEIQLIAEVNANDAERIAADLRAGRKGQLPVFNVQYDLSARRKISQSDIQADMCVFSETKAAKDLRGSPKVSEKFGWKVGPGGVELQQPFLTRDQLATFEGKMKVEVKLTIRLEDERDAVFLQNMQGYFDKVFQRLTIDTDKTPLGQQLAHMATYDFDPKDLSPDKIDKLVVDVKNFFNSEDMTFSNTEVGASASFAGFGGSANAKFTRQELRKRMEDKGWKFEEQGTKYVPKSFEVHVVSDTALKTEGAISGTVLREQRQFARFNHRLSTSNVYEPKSAKDQFVALEELKANVTKLNQDLGTPLDTRTSNTLASKLVCRTIEKTVAPPGGRGDFVGDGSAKAYIFTVDDASVVLGAWISVGSGEPNEQRVFRHGANYIGAKAGGENRVSFSCPVGGGDPTLRVPITVLYLKK